MALKTTLGALPDEIFVGEDVAIPFDIDDEATPAVPVNMAGYTLTFELTERRSPQVLITKTVGSGIAIGNSPAAPAGNGGTNARATVTIDDTDTDDLRPGTYSYVLRRTNAGLEKVLAYGSFILRKAP